MTEIRIDTLKTAKTPEQVFAGCTTEDDVQAAFRKASLLFHPDKHKAIKAKKQAEEHFKLLVSWRDKALEKINRKTFGNANSIDPVFLSTNTSQFALTERIAEGSLATVYYGTDKAGKEVAVKAVRDPRNSDLMLAEAKTLSTL